VPVKWLAKETLESRIYTIKTDVWGFAILCWEVYAEGAEPYPGLTNLQTRAKIVVQDYRMELPRVGFYSTKIFLSLIFAGNAVGSGQNNSSMLGQGLQEATRILRNCQEPQRSVISNIRIIVYRV